MPEPQFSAPWQAQVFSLVVALQDTGAFTPGEWAQALGAAIRDAQQAGDPDHGDTYYAHWVRALEGLLACKGMAGDGQMERLADAWAQAAERTPHGLPIELRTAELDIARKG